VNEDPTINDVLKELTRELEMRKALYPKWIESKKISAETAAHRIACLETAINLMAEFEGDDEDDLFSWSQRAVENGERFKVINNISWEQASCINRRNVQGVTQISLPDGSTEFLLVLQDYDYDLVQALVQAVPGLTEVEVMNNLGPTMRIVLTDPDQISAFIERFTIHS